MTVNLNAALPQHVAIIMDGNRRWARQRGLPSAIGHANGARQVRAIVEKCMANGVPYLTLFAFSTENWKRPAAEVSALMALLRLYLQKEVKDMNSEGVRLKVVGDTSRFTPQIQALIYDAQANTVHNEKIVLTIAVNYGGRWDCLQAVKRWQLHNPSQAVECLTEDDMRPYLAMAHAPDPDLLIRTGGEMRISNFMLWQLAYTELYFSDVLWPAFGAAELGAAFHFFGARDRRFGGAGLSAAA
jgi:undecaprenyl diphosphate synthase